MGKTIQGINRDRRREMERQAGTDIRRELLAAGVPEDQMDETMRGVTEICRSRGIPVRHPIVKSIVAELAAEVRAGKLFQRPENGPTINAADIGGPI